MDKRINISKTDAQAYKAMLGLETYLAQSEISKTIKELIKIRASQINGCAYCLAMHTKDAMKYGETAERIFLISAWHEAEKFFSAEEQIALKMTEEITLISQNGLTDDTYQKAQSHFSDKQIAELIMAIITINAWNRIALSTRLEIGE